MRAMEEGLVAERYDAVIIGGGHNGLVSAAYLARAGLKTLVLEQRHVLGGAAVTEELFPGFRFWSSRTSSRCSGRRSSASSSCRATASTSCRSTARSRRSGQGDGPANRAAATTSGGSTTTAGRSASSAAGRRRDAEAYEEYGQLMVEMARFIKPILGDHAARPDLARPAPAPAARRPAPDLPAAAGAPAGGLRPADDDERGRLPRPVVRDRSAQGDDERVGDHRDVPGRPLARHGVRPAPPLHGRDRRRVPGVGHPEGRHRRRSRTRSATRPGRSARRSGPRRRSRGSSSQDGRATGVVARGSGEEIEADVVLSSVDARRTFLGLLEPGIARRRVRGRGPAVQVPRLVRQGQPRGRPAARLHVPARRRRAPPRRDLVLARRSTRWSRPTTTRSTAASARKPYIDMIIPTLVDPSMAPPGKHVISCFVQYAPYKLAPELGDLGRPARGVRRRGRRPDRRVRAEHPRHRSCSATSRRRSTSSGRRA